MTHDSSTRTVDVAALVRLLAGTATDITALKRTLRTTWTRPMAAEQRELYALKRRATLLCILRAYLRGKRHVTTPPRDRAGTEWNAARYHRQMAERAVDRFELGALS